MQFSWLPEKEISIIGEITEAVTYPKNLQEEKLQKEGIKEGHEKMQF